MTREVVLNTWPLSSSLSMVFGNPASANVRPWYLAVPTVKLRIFHLWRAFQLCSNQATFSFSVSLKACWVWQSHLAHCSGPDSDILVYIMRVLLDLPIGWSLTRNAASFHHGMTAKCAVEDYCLNGLLPCWSPLRNIRALWLLSSRRAV